jgi:hypothetical protein
MEHFLYLHQLASISRFSVRCPRLCTAFAPLHLRNEECKYSSIAGSQQVLYIAMKCVIRFNDVSLYREKEFSGAACSVHCINDICVIVYCQLHVLC